MSVPSRRASFTRTRGDEVSPEGLRSLGWELWNVHLPLAAPFSDVGFGLSDFLLVERGLVHLIVESCRDRQFRPRGLDDVHDPQVQVLGNLEILAVVLRIDVGK